MPVGAEGEVAVLSQIRSNQGGNLSFSSDRAEQIVGGQGFFFGIAFLALPRMSRLTTTLSNNMETRL